jgi:hypothetical protein
VRRRSDHRLPARDAPDDDVQERPDEESEETDEDEEGSHTTCFYRRSGRIRDQPVYSSQSVVLMMSMNGACAFGS